jgi:hypothetical protein
MIMPFRSPRVSFEDGRVCTLVRTARPARLYNLVYNSAGIYLMGSIFDIISVVAGHVML